MIIGAAIFFPTHALAEKVDNTPKQSFQHEKTSKIKTDTHKQVSTVKNQTTRKVVKHSQKSALKASVAHTNKTWSVQVSSKAIKVRKAIGNQSKQPNLKAKKVGQAIGNQSKQPGLKAKKVGHVIENQSKQTGSTKEENRWKNNGKVKLASVKTSTFQREMIHPFSKPFLHTIDLKTPNERLNLNKRDHAYQIYLQSIAEKSNGNEMNRVSGIEHSNSSTTQNTPNPQKDYPKNLPDIISFSNNANSGGAPKNRVKLGHNLFSLTDQWFLRWERFWIIGVSPSFIYRIIKFCKQWTNAPPFQPPKRLLFS